MKKIRVTIDEPSRLVTDFTDDELHASGVKEKTIHLIQRLRGICPFCGGRHA